MSEDLREPKAEWASLPDSFRARLASALGEPISGAATVWGGFTPSATFRLELLSGRKVFCKAVGPQGSEFLLKAFTRERRALELSLN